MMPNQVLVVVIHSKCVQTQMHVSKWPQLTCGYHYEINKNQILVKNDYDTKRTVALLGFHTLVPTLPAI